MTALAGKVPTPTMFLILAGVIMVLTLYLSKKARSVVKTSLDLSRQNEGEERFKATWFSKVLVRSSLTVNTAIRQFVPDKVVAAIERQFEPYQDEDDKSDPPEFDLIRASVTLTVASILIAIGTSLKLPLSTTYVTFMVAMGTSLSDKAWDRESAVYRISGVVTVIGGWFFTALSAFTVAFALVFVFVYTEFNGFPFGILIVLILAVYLIYRTHIMHKKSSQKTGEETQDVHSISEENIADKSTRTIIKNLRKIATDYGRIIEGLEKEDVRELKKVKKSIDTMTAKTKYLKDHINVIVEKLRADSTDSAYYFVQVMDYMREMLHSISHIANPVLIHVDNNHKPLLPEQIEELKKLHVLFSTMVNRIIKNMETEDFKEQGAVQAMRKELIEVVEHMNKSLIKRLKNGEVGTKNSILCLNFFNETKNLVLQSGNLYKSQRDFVDYDSNEN
jgi:Na+/phosphate symporter